MQERSRAYIRWFETLGINDVPLVGGKNASLGEMYRELLPKSIKVPNGFALTSHAYRRFLAHNHLETVLEKIFSNLRPQEVQSIAECGRRAREALLTAEIPPDLAEEILESYHSLGDGRFAQGADILPDVAVRSSATAEDLPSASFAGQQESFLNVRGDRAVLDACSRCFSSLFTDRAISYRERLGYDHLRIALSIGIQRMVRSDLAVSGVMFTVDTETGFPNVILVNASYGLGESIVKGAVNPDEYLVFKGTLESHRCPILMRRVGSKESKLIYDTGGTKQTRSVPVLPHERSRLCLTDEEILTLSRWALLIESHYSYKFGKPTPMDIEWAKDGLTGEMYVLQARPETVHALRTTTELVRYELKGHGAPLLSGRSVGTKIGIGPVRVIRAVQDLTQMNAGEVLVADKTDPDWEPAMKKASAVVTNRGGRTCHAAIVSRELGIPAVVGTERATELLRDGQVVTVSCAEGEVGAVFDGSVAFEKKITPFASLPRPRTRVMVNAADPEQAFELSFLPVAGVGLARLEFIISNQIKIHPMALLDYESFPDGEVRQAIDNLTCGYPDKSRYFIEKLAEGVGMIAAAFYPRDVIVRFSDFKTNEYANLIGGNKYEPKEENPMLGFRGASRYYSEHYAPAFRLECAAIKFVREEMGLTNVKVMIPFCRTPYEAKRVLVEMERNGLRRNLAGLEIYVMCEIPSNVILMDQFAEMFDGFSIGSNDLAQLTLGVDRDSELLGRLFDERNPAVVDSIRTVIRKGRELETKVGICGQAPSDYPEFLEVLVREGIDSISLNADSVVGAIFDIARVEGESRK